MNQRQLFIAVLAGTAVCASTARAQFIVSAPTTDSLLTGSMTMAADALIVQHHELAEAVLMVEQAIATLESLNQGLSLAREVKRAGEFIMNYDWDDLQRDAQAALYNAIPELKDLDAEWRELTENGEAAVGGTFWKKRTYKDAISSRALRAGAEYAATSTMFAVLDRENVPRGTDLSDTEKFVQLHFTRAQMRNQRAKQNYAFSLQAAKLHHFIREVEMKDEIAPKIQATNAVSNHQTAVNSQFMRDAKAAEIAREEAHRLLGQQAEDALKKSLVDQPGSLFDIGIVD